MADGHRLYPVNKLVLHHAVTPEWPNESDRFLVDWFSNNGKARAYQNGAINPLHYKPGTRELSYSQAHFCLHPYTLDGNKYGWRLTPLIDDPWNNVVWGAGNWDINQRAINVEVAGNYLDHALPLSALMLLADTFRPHDVSIGGKLAIYAHKWITSTACPGQIEGQIGTVADMLNNQAKWEQQLWPAPAPAPEPTPAPPAPPVVAIKFERLAQPEYFVTNKPETALWDFNARSWGEFTAVDKFAFGHEFRAVGRALHPLGGVYYQTEYSFGQADVTGAPHKPWGVNKSDLTPAPAPAPVPEPQPEPVPAPQPPVEPQPTPEPEPEPTTLPAPAPQATQGFWQRLILAILKWWNNRKGKKQ